MSRRLAPIALGLALSGCFLTYDPESLPDVQGTGLALGAACSLDGQCASGQCVDGVCCGGACSGQCEACDVGGFEGTCVAVTGAPHGSRAACANDGSGCGGTCSGTLTTQCDYPTTLCRSQSCAGSTQTYAAFCSNGSCPAPSTLACDPYVCGATACKNGCGGDADCTSGNYCLSGSCVAKKAAGSGCTATNECQSGFCSPDGRCCDGACTGSCESCNGVNTGQPTGTCAPILAGFRPDPTHTGCTGDTSGVCMGSCDGSVRAVCSYPSVACRTASCTAGVETHAATCGAGSCPTISTAPCAPYACDAAACKTTCAVNGDCDSNSWCSGTSCVAKKSTGSTCTDGGQCTSGQCADGYCCNSLCGGCKQCNLAGQLGTCVNVPSGQDPHGTCSATSCQTTCNGSGACATALLGEYCASNACVDGAPDLFGRPVTATANVAWCSGTAQSCPAPSHPNTSCNGHTCDGGACNLTCLDNTDCVSGKVCVGGRCASCASGADCDPYASLCNGTYCDCPSDPGGCSYGCSVGYLTCQCNPGDNACNGRGPRCSGTGGSCSCGAVAGNLCPVGQLCSDSTTSGVCKIAPGFPCTANPGDCVSGGCTAGFCTKLPAGSPCAHGSDCANGTCTATWVCN